LTKIKSQVPLKFPERESYFRDLQRLYFYSKIYDKDNRKIIIDSMALRALAETIFIRLKSLIDPSSNPYITKSETKEEYLIFVGNLGRWNKKIDEFTNDLKNSLDGVRRVTFLREAVMETVDTLIVNPMRRANYLFNSIPDRLDDGSYIVKDFELYSYLLYREMVLAGEVLGVVTRESTGSRKIPNTNDVSFSRLSLLPDNIKTTNTPEDGKTIEEVVETFKEPNFDQDEDTF